MRFYEHGNLRLVVSGAQHKNFSCVVTTSDSGRIGLSGRGIIVRITTSGGCLVGRKNLDSFTIGGLGFFRRGAPFGENVCDPAASDFGLNCHVGGKIRTSSD